MANTKDYRDQRVSPSAVSYIEKLNLPALKKECIIRGLPFEKVCGSIPQLQTWFLNNYDNPIDRKRLEEYDQWATLLLKARNCDPSMLAPEFRLGEFIVKNAEGGVYKSKFSKNPKSRTKKPRTEDHLICGTKKAYTYELQKRGLSKAEVIGMVKEKYPTAKDKSIGIWFNKSKKLHAKA